MASEMDSQRLDKWLWMARFYKTRSLAAQAIAGGKVQVDGQRVKPARAVSVGAQVRVRKGSQEWEIRVKALSRQRRPAQEAQQIYEESPQSLASRLAGIEKRRQERAERALDAGRPSKRDRRDMMRLKRP